MDYQIVFKNHHLLVSFVLIMFSFLPFSLAIVNRDLILTPKQGLQLSGKRIFYEESFNSNDDALHNNDSVTRPWERTLKHVTYLTLFTNAANGIITGNFSKVKEYNDFLQSPYVHAQNPHDSRFGDIVTLAQGRLDVLPNGSRRFVEGNCDYECARDSNIIAMWHVQKIRHRDTQDRKYHYEMKYSVSPWTAKTPTETVVRGGPNKRTIMDEKSNSMLTFIQKDIDYPHSFSKIVSDKDDDFAERRFDATRNFRQVNPYQQNQQVTPIPQGTFLRGVYRPPPHVQPQQIPLPERLNMGEYYKGMYVPKASPKNELFPNLLNMLLGKSHPNHPRPEIYMLPQQQPPEFPKYPEYHHHSQEHFIQKVPTPNPMVTHHFHHHYFMPNNSAPNLEQAIQHSGEQKYINPGELYRNEVTEGVTPLPYITNAYEQHTTTLRQPDYQQHHITPHQQYQQPQHQYQQLQQDQFQPHQQQQQHQYQPPQQQQHLYQQKHSNYHQVQEHMPPAPQKFIFPNTQIEQQRVVHVTPAPPLRKPQYQHYYQNQQFTMQPEYTTVHVPLFISYPAPVNEEDRVDVPTPRNKPFLESEPLDDAIHYSEPDPLYAHINHEDKREDENNSSAEVEEELHDTNHEPQLESPEHYDHQHQNEHQTEIQFDNNKQHSEAVEAQLLAPDNSEDNQHQVDETKIHEDSTQSQTKQQNLYEQKPSQTKASVELSTEKSTSSTIKTEASNTILTATNKPKTFPSRAQRISLKATAATMSTTTTTTKPKTPSRKTTPPKTTKTERDSSTLTTTSKPGKHFVSTPSTETATTTSKPRKHFVSTSSTESPLRTISRYRNSNARSNTSTTTTEKPVLKWKPRRKSSNGKSMAMNISAQETYIEDTHKSDDGDDIKAKESNYHVKKLFMFSSSTTDKQPESTTEMSNDITTIATSTISSLLLSSQPPMTTQSETDIYEVLTQKSISKSVSLKVGKNGEEISVIVDDQENEVNKV